MPQERVENQPRHTTVRVLGLFIAAFLAAVLMSLLQHHQRESLETTQAPTAVGDRHYFEFRRPVIWERPVGAIGERRVYLASDEEVDREDLLMRKVAWTGTHHIYEDSGSPGSYFLKVSPGRYLAAGLSALKQPALAE